MDKILEAKKILAKIFREPDEAKREELREEMKKIPRTRRSGSMIPRNTILLGV